MNLVNFMVVEEKLKSSWKLITIDDPLFLPGKSIYDVIKLILKKVDLKFVVISEVYGCGISSLLEVEYEIIKIDQLLKVICEVKQFDWCDFYLFLQYPKDWFQPTGITDYPFLIQQTYLTIRAVDDQYIYIYTTSEEIARLINKSYLIESLKTDQLENLEFPY